jgi:hypothetical protein
MHNKDVGLALTEHRLNVKTFNLLQLYRNERGENIAL